MQTFATPAQYCACVALLIVQFLDVAGALKTGMRATSRSGTDGSSSSSGSSDSAFMTPLFFAPQMTPVSFLFISSPEQKKIVYTELKNFKSKTGRTYALVDAGLEEPCGLAFDRQRGDLYVADRKALRIFRYSIFVEKKKDADGNVFHRLSTDGNRLMIMSGHSVEWVAVNHDGNVFYSDQNSKSINKITRQTMASIANGEISATDLQVVSEKTQEAISSAKVSSGIESSVLAPTDPPPATAEILAIYEGSINSHVTVPSGIASDGMRLYWGNSLNGQGSGSVVAGEVYPQSPPNLAPGSDPAPFPCTVLAQNTEQSYGVAKTNTMVFYSSQNQGNNNSGVVYGALAHPIGAQTVSTVAMGLQQPRGLAWDGDNTVYVADQGSNTVWSFPSGRLIDGAPLSQSVSFVKPYGLALLTENDQAFNIKAGSIRVTGTGVLTVALVLVAQALAS